MEDYSYFRKGLYIQQLTRLYSIFNKDQILVLKSEDLFNGNLNTLLNIYNFLGVSIPDPIIFPHFNYDKDELQMDRSIRTKLYSLYSRSIMELQEYMNMKFNWDE